MIDSYTRDRVPWQRLTADSWDAGWRSLLVRRFIQRPSVDVVVPASAEQKITLLLHGQKDTAVRHGGRWRHAGIGAGSLSMTAAGRPTRIRWTATSAVPLVHLSVHLPPAVMQRAAIELWGEADPARMPDALDTADPVLPRLLPALLQAAVAGESDLYAESAAEFLAVHLLIHHGRRPAAPGPRAGDGRVRQAQAYLHDHVTSAVSLAELAAEVGLSRYHLLRLFLEHTGQTPSRYLTRLRMQRARDLLEHGTADISAIAATCGYADASPFARAFRRDVGCSPAAYRRSMGLHR